MFLLLLINNVKYLNLDYKADKNTYSGKKFPSNLTRYF